LCCFQVAQHWEEIRKEVEALNNEGFILWPERDLYNGARQ